MAQNGFLLIADITGYTMFLTRSELEHAQGILDALFKSIFAEIKAPIILSNLQGDAARRWLTCPTPTCRNASSRWMQSSASIAASAIRLAELTPLENGGTHLSLRCAQPEGGNPVTTAIVRAITRLANAKKQVRDQRASKIALEHLVAEDLAAL